MRLNRSHSVSRTPYLVLHISYLSFCDTPCYNDKKMSGANSKSGFTLIEVLIVVAISAMLAAIAIGYSGTERDQTTLSVEETKISQFILQARSLSIATYGNAAGSACGYGVSFDAASKTYSVFAYVPNGSGTCPPVASVTSASQVQDHEARYTDETWQVHPANDVTFSMANSNALSLVLFYPPDPITLLFDGSGNPINQATVNLAAANGSSRTISINSAGQVSF